MLACGAAAVVLPRAAFAGDGVRPRTLVQWPDDVPCLLEVDRTRAPVVVLPYTIPFEDPPPGEDLTEDEVADGRRHQFLALRADIDPRLALPEWISDADVQAAAAKGLVDPATVQPQAVLEHVPVLADVLVRIDADDARRPITFAVADAGASWDTSAVPAGTYVVRAYTWDPRPSAWALPRRGAIRVFDTIDDPALVPALAVAITPTVLHRDEVGMIQGCLAAPAGTTLSAAWADFTDPQGAFTEFASGIVADDGAIAIAFEPPEPLWGGFGVLRVRATDPAGLVYDAFVPDRVTILATDGPSDCDTAFVDGCGSSSSGAASGAGSSGDGTTAAVATGSSASDAGPAGETSGGAPADAGTTAQGCGCRSSRPGGAWAPLVVALAASRRRRRRDATTPARARGFWHARRP
ncbi:MAG: hypothetical protein K1X88_33925 [Nannocystaceae bacterium]|nr:hypothetical protein [Nannocystaceae bacterium]